MTYNGQEQVSNIWFGTLWTKIIACDTNLDLTFPRNFLRSQTSVFL